MTTKILALTDALGNLVRFRLMPGQRYDSVEVPPLIEDIAFDGLIADKAFDNNVLVAELNGRGARIVISQHPARAETQDRCQHLHLAAPHRELLLQAQRVQAHRHACMQDRQQLQGDDLPRRRRHQLTMNPHSP